MKATEFRIGNLVQHNGEILPIGALHSDDTLRLEKDCDSIGCFGIMDKMRIPLTEEWLLKFGIVKQDDRFITTDIIPYSWIKKTGYFFTITSSDGLEVNLYYVHQLQNLYFALTGEDLNIKKAT